MLHIQRPTNPDISVRNPRDTVYIKGDEFTDGSFRFIIDLDQDEVHIEERISGVWVLTTMTQTASSWLVDDNLGEFVLEDATGEVVTFGPEPSFIQP